MARRRKDDWEELCQRALKLIGREAAARVARESTDEADRARRLLAEVLDRTASSRRSDMSHFEFQMRRSERLAAIGQMAAGLVHEVNNPLGALSGFIQLMIADFPDKAKGQEMLDEMSGEVRRIRGTLDRLLDFARASAGISESRRVRLDVSEVVSDTLALIMPQAHFSRIELTKAFPPDPAEAVGNPDELKQVFMNIFLNAIQAMPTGGKLDVSVAVGPAAEGDVPPHAATRRQGDPPGKSFLHMRRSPGDAQQCALQPWEAGDAVVKVAVTDTGVGIRPEHVDLIFEPFFTTKGRGEGTGLGLSTSLGIVTSHGGDIQVKSVPGRGSTFTVLLPAVKGSPARRSGADG